VCQANLNGLFYDRSIRTRRKKGTAMLVPTPVYSFDEVPVGLQK
jgi:hypothetical protein